MLSCRIGRVLEVKDRRPGYSELTVLMTEGPADAINYDVLTGPVAAGDSVLLNTTAVELGLGTGGYHFVMANHGNDSQEVEGQGHIMKLRYTPLQLKVLAVEEEASPHRGKLEACRDLAGMPVVAAPLHSLLAPVAAGLKAHNPALRLAYIMTDSAALPLYLSRLVPELKGRGLLETTITVGQAFGGDYEAVTVYSGLLAAKAVAGADVALVAMGPGNVGTNTTWGFCGLEQGEVINATYVLGGRAIAVPRLSFADPRQRHRGLSHHTLTALGRVALAQALVPLPPLSPEKKELVEGQLEESGLRKRHRFLEVDGGPGLDLLRNLRIEVRSMGRTVEEDQDFFAAGSAAGRLAALLATK